MVRTNLELPLLLSNLLLRDLKKSKGYLLQISSVTALKNSPHGCAYGATKAGLTAFSRSLFDEARKYGVKVTVIHPDMTQTKLYRNADFTAAEDLQASLLPEDVGSTHGAGCQRWYGNTGIDGVPTIAPYFKKMMNASVKQNDDTHDNF